MSNLPKRYQFDNELPAHRPMPLPEQRQVGQVDPPVQPPQVVHNHVHMAPPDRTLTKLTLGAGIGGGAVVATVLLLPLVIEMVHALVASLAVLALLVAVVAWAIVTIVQAIGSAKGQQAAKTVRKGRRRRG